jgi:hypothetical protein
MNPDYKNASILHNVRFIPIATIQPIVCLLHKKTFIQCNGSDSYALKGLLRWIYDNDFWNVVNNF